jgi:uncharacterized protein YoxC
MNDQSKNPLPDLNNINASVTAAVTSHRTKLRVLTGAALSLGLIAVAISFLILVFYPVMYLPKQKELMKRAETAAAQSKTETVEQTVNRLDRFVHVEILMTHVVSMGTTIVAAAVGALALGTLVLVMVVTINRRSTLQQINVSLAQISAQLKQLQLREGKG